MFIGGGGLSGAGIAFGTTMALTSRSRGRGAAGISNASLDSEVYEAFQNFKKGQAHYNYYLDEDTKRQEAIDEAQEALKTAALYVGQKPNAYEVHDSRYVAEQFKRFEALTTHVQSVRVLGSKFTPVPYTPPLSSAAESAKIFSLNRFRDTSEQDRNESALIQKVSQALHEKNIQLAQLVESANQLADKEKQQFGHFLSTIEITSENHQSLAEGVKAFPQWNNPSSVLQQALVHFESTEALQSSMDSQATVASLWEPMKQIVDTALAAHGEQDLVRALTTLRANIKMHSEFPELLGNREANENMLGLFQQLEAAQVKQAAPHTYGNTKSALRNYFTQVSKNDHALVLDAREEFIETSTYGNATKVLTQLQHGLNSQKTLNTLSQEQQWYLTSTMTSYGNALTQVQTLCTMGLSGEKPEHFDQLLSTVAEDYNQKRNAIVLAAQTGFMNKPLFNY